MKKYIIIIVSLMVFPFCGFTQDLDNIDQIAPYHEDLAAVRKGKSWAFINTNGDIVIDFRDDLVWTEYSELKGKKAIRKEPVEYPYFAEGRCLISTLKDGFKYYGFIDKTGKTVIEPNFINATVFDKGHAIVLKVSKDLLGRNEVLGKDVIAYSYGELVINSEGEKVAYLKGPINLVMSQATKRQPPKIESYMVSPKVVATRLDGEKWKMIPLDADDKL